MTIQLLLCDPHPSDPIKIDRLPCPREGQGPVPRHLPSGYECLSPHLSGWGIVVAQQSLHKLSWIERLIAHRARQQKISPGDLQKFVVVPEYRDDVIAKWQFAHQSRFEPKRVQYFLILGDFKEVPLYLQQRMALNTYVGRICFEHEAEYRAYADKVVEHEEGWEDWGSPSRVLWYAPPEVYDVKRDVALQQGRKLVQETHRYAESEPIDVWVQNHQITRYDPSEASDEPVLLDAANTTDPTILLSITHGVFGSTDDEKRTQQGTPVIQKATASTPRRVWSIPKATPFLPQGLWFSKACFGAGTPPVSLYRNWRDVLAPEFKSPQDVAKVKKMNRYIMNQPGTHGFVARFPQQRLACPNGPLAIMAHADISWTFGFQNTDRDLDATVYCDVIYRAALGYSFGEAFQRITHKAQQIATQIALRNIDLEPRKPKIIEGKQWLRFLDLSSTLLLGDPATRLGTHKARIRVERNEMLAKKTQTPVATMPVSFDAATPEAALHQALDDYDWSRAERIVERIEDDIRKPSSYPADQVILQLEALQKYQRRDLMIRVAETFLEYEPKNPTVERMYAQTLIDHGQLLAASRILRDMDNRPSLPDRERKEIKGLLCRIHKQRFVNAWLPHAPDFDQEDTKNLEKAVLEYLALFETTKHYWFGVNAASLLAMGRRNKCHLNIQANPVKVAQAVLSTLPSMSDSSPDDRVWIMATKAEAQLLIHPDTDAYNKFYELTEETQENQWLADAFHLNSILRQLVEVHELETQATSQRKIINLMRQALLQRTGGQIELTPRLFAPKDHQEASTLGRGFIDNMLQQAQGVGRISHRGETIGTGFVISGETLDFHLAGKKILVTNHHVAHTNPYDANVADIEVCFEGMNDHKSRVGNVVFESPPDQLDVTMTELENAPAQAPNYRLADAPDEHRKLYVIGHPRGREMSFSIQNNECLGTQSHYVHYRTPTEPGSSGSPVFDDQWNLVALHHYGGSLSNRGVSMSAIQRAVQHRRVV